MRFGINLYSLRTLISDEESFLQTAYALAEQGYDTIQFSGAPYNADVIKKVSVKSGLPVVLTHVPMDRIINDTEKLMAEHESFGCRCIGLGSMPREIIGTEKFRETVELLNRAGAKMAENGFTFCYHHHHYELYKSGGETALDYMIKNAPDIHFTADTYWLQYGGADVLKTIEKLKGRVDCLHLKDYRINRKTDEAGRASFEPGFAPVGDGVIDFAAVIAAAEKSGTKHFLVEQDDAVNYPDPLGQAGRSIKYLKDIISPRVGE